MKNTYTAREIESLAHAYTLRIKALRERERELNDLLQDVEEWDDDTYTLARELFDIVEELRDWNR